MRAELASLIAEVQKGKLQPVYLFWGDEFLVRKDAEELIPKLVPDAAAGLNHFVMDGASPKEIALELSTMPLFPGRKVVYVRDPEFLAPKKGRGDGLARVRDAWKAGRRKEAGRRLLALAAKAGWGLEKIDPASAEAASADAWQDELSVALADGDAELLKEIAAYCRAEGVTTPESDAAPLMDLLAQGAPTGHALVIAASEVDAKNPLVKWAESHGAVVDRQVAARMKDLDLTELAQEVLRPWGKKLARDAEAALRDRVGGNMRLVQSELEKLALYAQGATIERADVELLVARSREEEYLELADALQKKDLASAQRYVDDALEQGSAPLMLLGSITSVIRGLAEEYERLQTLAQGRPPRNFDDFKARLFPVIEQELKERKQKVPHPYGVFLKMAAAARYSRPQLRQAWLACAEADLALKSSGQAKLTLERLVWTICTPGPALT